MANTGARRKVPKIYPPWQHIRRYPILSLTRRAYAMWAEQQVRDRMNHHVESTARIVCIADTHNNHGRLPPLPPGDILIHAGDLTQSGTEREAHAALAWLNSAPHAHKVFIAGNHDDVFAVPQTRNAILATYPDLIYLEDSSATLTVHNRQLNLYGSPRTPKRGTGVFQYPPGEGAWTRIPAGTDILITHGPPKSHLDLRGHGCDQLRQALWDVRPPLHIFGHIHGGRGMGYANWSPFQHAYERVCDARTGWVPMVRVLSGAVGAVVHGGKKNFSVEGGRGTVFVNAACADGLQDGLFREAITVEFAQTRLVAATYDDFGMQHALADNILLRCPLGTFDNSTPMSDDSTPTFDDSTSALDDSTLRNLVDICML